MSRSFMLEAVRLTRLGRLGEATAVIQRGLGAPDRPFPPKPNLPGVKTGQTHRAFLEFASDTRSGESRWSLAQTASSLPAERNEQSVRQGKLSPSARPARSRLRGPFRSIEPLSRVDVTAPDGASFRDHIFSGAAGARKYKLYVPGRDNEIRRPLVVMLHGCNQSAEDFACGTRMNVLADEFGFCVAYPEQPASANPSKCWNWFDPSNQSRDSGEAEIIAGLTREVMATEQVDPGRVYIAGLSAGGAAAAVMASKYPDLYAAAGVHSGLACGAARNLPSAFAAMQRGRMGAASNRSERSCPLFVIHGDSDTTVNPINGEQVADFHRGSTRRVRSGRTAQGVQFTVTEEIENDGKVRVEHWRVHGLGHAWSGGDSAGSYVDARGPDASREMARFFLSHRLADDLRID